MTTKLGKLGVWALPCSSCWRHAIIPSDFK